MRPWAECQKASPDTPEQSSEASQTERSDGILANVNYWQNVSKDKEKEAAGIVEVPENMVIAYVDGSFEKSIGRYAFWAV